MLPVDDVWAATRHLPGWLTKAEAARLYELAGYATAPIVEVGTFCGKSTCFLCAGGQQEVYAIDPHDLDARNEDELRAHPDIDSLKLAKAKWRELLLVPHVVKRLSGDAGPYVPKVLGGVFLDGDHRPEALTADLELYGLRIVPGGWLAVHDWGMQGSAGDWDVAGCTMRWLAGRDFEELDLTGALAVFRRQEAPDGAD